MNLFETKYRHPYDYAPEYSKRVAYFSMEYAIDQSLKLILADWDFLPALICGALMS